MYIAKSCTIQNKVRRSRNFSPYRHYEIDLVFVSCHKCCCDSGHRLEGISAYWKVIEYSISLLHWKFNEHFRIISNKKIQQFYVYISYSSVIEFFLYLLEYPCEVCERRFGTRKHLHQHMLSHGEKRFQCKFCGQKFATTSGRRVHDTRSHGAI